MGYSKPLQPSRMRRLMPDQATPASRDLSLTPRLKAVVPGACMFRSFQRLIGLGVNPMRRGLVPGTFRLRQRGSGQSLPQPILVGLFSLLSAGSSFADTTNLVFASPSLPDAAPSLLRVVGALALVIGLFLGCVWVFRNGRHLAVRRGRAPRLNILEVRSLGARQSIYVVGYEQQRFLLGSTPAGINLISHLPPASEQETPVESSATLSFSQALTQVLRGQSGGAK